jgi:hypothetical protein
MCKKILIFCIIFYLLYLTAVEVLKEKYVPFRDRTTYGFFNEPKDSLDVVFLGPSITRAHINPGVLWRDFGITSYSFAHDNCNQTSILCHMMEASKYQANSIFVIDVALFIDNAQKLKLGDIHQNYYSLPLSWCKIHGIIKSSHKGQVLANLFSIAKFHPNWQRLRKEFFSYAFYSEPNLIRGVDVYWHKRDEYKKLDDNLINPASSLPLLEEAEFLTRKILQYAKDNNRRLVLTNYTQNNTNPEYWRKHKRIEEIAKEYGVPYLNLSRYMGGEGHISFGYTPQVAKLVGSWLQEHFKIQDKRGDAQLATYWKPFVEAVELQYNSFNLMHERDFSKFLPLLSNPNYTVFISVRDTAVRHDADVKQEIVEAWKALKLNPAILSKHKHQHAYIAVIDGGKVIHEETAWNFLSWKKAFPKLGGVFIESGGLKHKKFSRIRINTDEKSHNRRGFNIVVYDKIFDFVVLNTSFDTFTIGY